TGVAMPDLPALPPVPGMPILEPLPEASASEVIGLLEYLNARSGKEDIFRIAGDIHYEFGRLLPIVEAAELLELVDTPKRQVVLDPPGQRLLQAKPEQRTALWREQLMKLNIFKIVHETLERQPNHEVDRDFVLETLVMRMPHENYGKMFATFINWARFG